MRVCMLQPKLFILIPQDPSLPIVGPQPLMDACLLRFALELQCKYPIIGMLVTLLNIVDIAIQSTMGEFQIFFLPLGAGTAIGCDSTRLLWQLPLPIPLVSMISLHFNGLEVVEPTPVLRSKT